MLARGLGFFLLLVSVLSARAADPDPLESETLGGLKLGQSAAELVKRLGPPKSKGKEVEWGATGDWVVEWRYPDKGLKFQMASGKKGGSKTILTMESAAPSQLATAKGIKLGSSEAEVRKVYGSLEEKEQSKPGESFVAGSIYGGIIFRFKNGKVDSIFFGAAAE